MKNMNKPQWPTLQDRLNHPLKDELTALQQLKQVLPLSKQAQELYDKLSKESLDYQSLMGKTTALEAENVELKAKLDDLHKWINQGGGKKTNT